VLKSLLKYYQFALARFNVQQILSSQWDDPIFDKKAFLSLDFQKIPSDFRHITHILDKDFAVLKSFILT
jgi:hypothetical protein